MSTDDSFRAWLATRDPATLAAVFDRTAPQLLLVAMHLVGDAADAEDLVQQTFLEAIRGAERFDRARPVLPWLTAILHRRAIDLRRRRRRAPRLDDAAADDRLPGPLREPGDEAASAELHARIAAAVDGLPERYHQVLTLRFVHGLRVTAIASALRRPVGTVHAQIHRGLALLKRALPKEIVPVVAAVLLGRERGLAAVRASVLTAAPAPVVAAAGGGGVAAWLAPVLLAALAVAATCWLWPTQDRPAAPAAAATTPVMGAVDQTERPPRPEREQVAIPDQPLRERSGAPPPDPDDPHAVHFTGRVVAAESGEPLAGVTIWFRQSKRSEAGPRLPGNGFELVAEKLVTVADGRFDFVARRRFETSFSLLLLHRERIRRSGFFDDGSGPSALASVVGLGDVPMHRGARLVGRVVDQLDRPTSASLMVRLADQSLRGLPGAELGIRDFHPVAWVDENGVLGDEPAVVPFGTWTLFDDTDPVLAPASIMAHAERPTVEVAVRVHRRIPIAQIEGRLVDPEGRPVAGLLVGAWPDGASSFRTRERTDEEGRFKLELHDEARREPVRLRVAAWEPHGWATIAPERLVRWGERNVTVIARPPRPVVVEVVAASTGEPIQDFGLEIGEAGGARQLTAFGRHPAGVASIDFLGDDDVDVTVIPADRELRITRRRLVIPPDRRLRIAVGAGTPLTVQVTTAGRPLPGARVRVVHTQTLFRSVDGNHLLGDLRAWFGTGHGAAGTPFDDDTLTDAAGLAELHADAVWAEQLLMVEHPLGRAKLAPLPPQPWLSPLRVDLEAAGAVRGLVLHPELARSMATHVELVREIDGRFAKGQYRGDEGPHWVQVAIDADGGFEARGLRPGRYRLGLANGLVDDPPTIVEVRSGAVTAAQLDPRPLLPGQLRAQVTVDGQPAGENDHLVLLRIASDGALMRPDVDLTTRRDGTLQSDCVPAGTYRIATYRTIDDRPRMFLSTAPITVEPGRSHAAQVDLRIHVVRLELRRPDGEAVPPAQWQMAFDDPPIVGDARDCPVPESGEIRCRITGEDGWHKVRIPLTAFRDEAPLVERVFTVPR